MSDEFDNATVALQVQQFLDEWHYRVLHSLGGAWDQEKSTAAALKLFKMHGAQLTDAEVEEFSTLDEALLVDKVVAKMPDACKASFEHFVLQLQMIVSTACRVRSTIEAENADEIELALGACDGGVSSQILKQAIVQAGKEVGDIRCRHESWVKSTDTRINRLVRSADDASHAQSQLRALESQLGSFGGSQNDKSKKMMMGVAANNDKALLQCIFTTWLGWQLKVKSEKDIRDKFEAEIEAAEAKLMEYRQAALNNVRNVLMRKCAENDGNLMLQVWRAWADEVQETKREAGSQEEMKKLEAKIAGFSAAQAENNKKVMARMSAGSDNALLTVVIGSWVQFIQEYKKNKEVEDEVKRKEQAIQEHLKKKKADTANVLDRMNSATESGLLEHCMSSWCQKYKDDADARKMDELMCGANDKFASLNGRQKDNAKGVMGRVNEQVALNLMLRHFCAWSLDAKLERVMRHYNNKMDSKKHQLQSVQHLFRNFASQLDQGLRQKESPGRSEREKDDAAFFLPDIHKKPR